MKSLTHLLEVGSATSICAADPLLDWVMSGQWGARGRELIALLKRVNGFRAFSGALHMFSSGDLADPLSLERWNSVDTWRSTYIHLTDNCLFFAQDVFASQFCIFEEKVYRFDSETGDKDLFSSTLEEWGARILERSGQETGYPMLMAWEEEFGVLAESDRLIPKLPFCMGGQFSVDNLRAEDAIQAMRFYGSLAIQLHELPDGAQIELKVVE